jgi:hypothetical protein
MRTPTPTPTQDNELTPRDCAALLGLAKPVKVHCRWQEGRAICTAIARGYSVMDAVARLRKLWNIDERLTIQSQEVIG